MSVSYQVLSYSPQPVTIPSETQILHFTVTECYISKLQYKQTADQAVPRGTQTSVVFSEYLQETYSGTYCLYEITYVCEYRILGTNDWIVLPAWITFSS